MKILVLTALSIEQAFIPSLPNVDFQIIGTGENCVQNIKIDKHYDHVILFGTCGLLMGTPNNVLYMPAKTVNWETKKEFNLDSLKIKNSWYVLKSVTTPFLVKDIETKNLILKENNYDFVDMEDAWVVIFCQLQKIPLTVIRYAIDRCNHPLKPKGINFFYRYFQHIRMQWKFYQNLKLLTK